jgi:isocitrate/isopropylmalate dehydrogenase
MGTPFPEETKKLCFEADAILFGATGEVSSSVLYFLRWGDLNNYVNIRPVKYYPGAVSPLKNPEGIDYVILRENSEGLYPPGREGELTTLAEKWPDFRDALSGKGLASYGEGKFAIRVISKHASGRMAKFACEFTRQRKKSGYPGKLTCVTKSNVLKESCGLFQAAVEEEIKNYPELTYEHYYIDDMARRILRYPKDMDVIVTTNMFGDILSDAAAETIGGLGLAASANVGGLKPYFEPVHGSAPKYAGKNVINPTAMILSAKMMLENLKMDRAAQALEEAVAEVYREGKSLTYDQGKKATTTQFGQAVLSKLP